MKMTKMTRRNGNGLTNIVDIANIILGIFITICAVFLLIDIKTYSKLFLIVFILGAVLNINMSVKYYKRNDMVRMLALSIFALILIILAVFSLLTVWI